MSFWLYLVLYSVLSFIGNSPDIGDNAAISTGIVDSVRFVQSHDYINALKELDWIEMLDRFQGRTVMNVHIRSYRLFNIYRMRAIIDKNMNNMTLYIKHLHIACSFIDKTNKLFIDEVLACHFDEAMYYSETMDLIKSKAIKDYAFTRPFFDEEIWNVFNYNYINNGTMALVHDMDEMSSYFVAYLFSVTPQYFFDMSRFYYERCKEVRRNCVYFTSMQMFIRECGNSPVCYNSFYEAVTHRELVQSYGHLKLNRFQTHWLSFITHSYLTFGLVFPKHNYWLAFKIWSRDLLSFFTKKQSLLTLLLVIVGYVSFGLYKKSYSKKMKDKKTSEAKSHEKVSTVISKDCVATDEQSSDHPKVLARTPESHLPVKETRVVKEPEVISTSRSKRAKKRSGKKEKIATSVLHLHIPCHEHLDQPVFLLMKDCDWVNQTSAMTVQVDKDILFAWELVKESDGYSLILQSSFLGKSKESVLCFTYCYGVCQSHKWCVSEWYSLDTLSTKLGGVTILEEFSLMLSNERVSVLSSNQTTVCDSVQNEIVKEKSDVVVKENESNLESVPIVTSGSLNQTVLQRDVDSCQVDQVPPVTHDNPAEHAEQMNSCEVQITGEGEETQKEEPQEPQESQEPQEPQEVCNGSQGFYQASQCIPPSYSPVFYYGVPQMSFGALQPSQEPQVPPEESFQSSREPQVPLEESFQSSREPQVPPEESFQSSQEPQVPLEESFQSSQQVPQQMMYAMPPQMMYAMPQQMMYAMPQQMMYAMPQQMMYAMPQQVQEGVQDPQQIPQQMMYTMPQQVQEGVQDPQQSQGIPQPLFYGLPQSQEIPQQSQVNQPSQVSQPIVYGLPQPSYYIPTQQTNGNSESNPQTDMNMSLVDSDMPTDTQSECVQVPYTNPLAVSNLPFMCVMTPSGPMCFTSVMNPFSNQVVSVQENSFSEN